eukprot:365243-Chlamydomonas_euryale.AAC.22
MHNHHPDSSLATCENRSRETLPGERERWQRQEQEQGMKRSKGFRRGKTGLFQGVAAGINRCLSSRPREQVSILNMAARASAFRLARLVSMGQHRIAGLAWGSTGLLVWHGAAPDCWFGMGCVPHVRSASCHCSWFRLSDLPAKRSGCLDGCNIAAAGVCANCRERNEAAQPPGPLQAAVARPPPCHKASMPHRSGRLDTTPAGRGLDDTHIGVSFPTRGLWGWRPRGTTTRSAGRGGGLSSRGSTRRRVGACLGSEQSFLSSCTLDPIVWRSARLGQAKGD